jgi:fumarate hydratase subunit alpha
MKGMRLIEAAAVTEAVKGLCIEAAYRLGDDVVAALRSARAEETSPVACDVLDQLLANAGIAAEGVYPLCQDTGLAVVFADLGHEVRVTDGDLESAITEGVRRGYTGGYLRGSVCHCFSRANTGDNTPAIIHLRLVPGDRLGITLAAKGGGSENQSRVTMLNPSQGREGILDFVVGRVRDAGADPCPPLVVGVGIGGNMELAALLAKRSLLRPLGKSSADPVLDALERELLARINRLGIGPAGLGGRTTALAVHAEMAPCHIASLPLAVNLDCHAHRRAGTVL